VGDNAGHRKSKMVVLHRYICRTQHDLMVGDAREISHWAGHGLGHGRASDQLRSLRARQTHRRASAACRHCVGRRHRSRIGVMAYTVAFRGRTRLWA